MPLAASAATELDRPPFVAVLSTSAVLLLLLLLLLSRPVVGVESGGGADGAAASPSSPLWCLWNVPLGKPTTTRVPTLAVADSDDVVVDDRPRRCPGPCALLLPPRVVAGTLLDSDELSSRLSDSVSVRDRLSKLLMAIVRVCVCAVATYTLVCEAVAFVRPCRGVSVHTHLCGR